MSTSTLKPLTDAQRDALESEFQSVQKVASMAVGRFRGRITFDEALSSASMGAIRATSTHDADKGRSLRSHIYQRAQGEIIDDLRTQTGHRRHTGNPSVNKPESLGWDKARSIVARDEPDESMESALDMIRKVVPRCTRTQTAMRMVFIEGFTMREAGAAIGLSEARVSQLLTQARRIGRAVLNGN